MDIKERFEAKGTVSKKFTVPLKFWEEWEEDAKDKFNNTYHLKMQFDHEFRKQFNSIANYMMQDLVAIKEDMFDFAAKLEAINSQLDQDYSKDKKSRQKQSEEPERPKTMGSLNTK